MNGPDPNSDEFHELAGLFPMMSAEEYAGLVEDIRKNGLQEPLVMYETRILDGRNRYLACRETSTPLRSVDYTGSDPRAYVLSLNLHRRHLNAEQKRAVIDEKLRTDPSRSNGAIAAEVKADPKTVAARRSKLEATQEIPESTVRVGKDGRQINVEGLANSTKEIPESHDPFAEPEPDDEVFDYVARLDAELAMWEEARMRFESLPQHLKPDADPELVHWIQSEYWKCVKAISQVRAERAKASAP